MIGKAALLAVVLTLTLAMPAAEGATKLTLRDGTVLVGEIVEQGEQTITLEWGEHRIPVERSRIVGIELNFDPDGPAPSAARPAREAAEKADEPAREPRRASERYLVIPIAGAGPDYKRTGRTTDAPVGFVIDDPRAYAAIAPGVSAALDFALRKGVEHVVFDIDTSSGSIEEASLIAREIEAARGRAAARNQSLTLHALVRQSVGPGLAITFSCDHIYMMTSGRTGAALAWFPSASSDGDSHPGWASQLRTWADVNGHNGAIAEALASPAIELWSWHDASGASRLGSNPPASASRTLSLISGAETRLTLSASDAVGYGVAQYADDAAQIGALLGIESWAPVGDHGRALMHKTFNKYSGAEVERREAFDAISRKVNETTALLINIPGQVARAREKDPENWDDYRRRTGDPLRFQSTADLWEIRTDAAIDAWRTVKSASSQANGLFDDAEALKKKAVKITPYWAFEGLHNRQLAGLDTMLRPLDVSGPDLKRWTRTARSEISTLIKNRGRFRCGG